jgi:hypothetical protein
LISFWKRQDVLEFQVRDKAYAGFAILTSGEQLKAYEGGYTSIGAIPKNFERSVTQLRAGLLT